LASAERNNNATIPPAAAKPAATDAEKSTEQGDEPAGAANLAMVAANFCGCQPAILGFAATRSSSHTRIHPFAAPEALCWQGNVGQIMLLTGEDAN
jgi:hypothetical protein